jgi:hypothetical protein
VELEGKAAKKTQIAFYIVQTVSKGRWKQMNHLAPCSRALLEKLRVAQLVGKFPYFMESKYS